MKAVAAQTSFEAMQESAGGLLCVLVQKPAECAQAVEAGAVGAAVTVLRTHQGNAAIASPTLELLRRQLAVEAGT